VVLKRFAAEGGTVLLSGEHPAEWTHRVIS
jgi:hypothetical protein